MQPTRPDETFGVRLSTVALKRNVIANYIGQGTRALMGFVFVPVYVRYLGIEAYGLIGLFAVLQAWLGLLDLGIRPALGREMARFSGGAHSPTSIRDLLRSVEVLSVGLAGVASLSIWASSPWLATHWVAVKTLPIDSVTRAFAVMGVVAALRFVENIYVSSIVGLQRQVLENVVTTLSAVARGVGAIGVLAWVSPSIQAFFFWQGLVSVATVTIFGFAVHTVLPRGERPARFSLQALRDVWRFAGGMLVIALLTLLLVNTDKILLARMLTLEAFGYYAMASVLANALGMLAAPITTAISPRLTELTARGDEKELRAIYHLASQFVTVIAGSAAIILVAFAWRVILVWTDNQKLTEAVAPLVQVLAAGTALNIFLWIPYQLQLANGWTSLTIKVCAAATLILVPAIIWVVPRYGALGAGFVWLLLNIGQLLVTVNLMHNRLLTTERWLWYGRDIALPLVTAAGVAFACRIILPVTSNRLFEAGLIALASACTLVAGLAAAPAARARLMASAPAPLRAFRAP